jgi:Acetyltransferase (GNAT) domain
MSQRFVISEVDAAQWDELVDWCALSTVYHRNGWLGAVEACEGVAMKRVACWDGDALVALWPIGILKMGPMRVGGSPLPGWNTAYLGPIFTARCEDKLEAVRAMMQAKPISNPSFVATRSIDVEMDWSGLGFTKARVFETYEIDLTREEDELFAALKGTCRTRVRKGRKNGLEVRVEEGDGYIEDFWTMASDVFAKSRQKPPYSKKFLRAVHERLFDAGELLVTSAFLGDERIATLIVPHDGKTGMYFAGGTFADKLSLAPNNLLHWETMMACKRLGMERYDFISNRGKPGKFKKTFGPDERVSCVHWERAKNPAVKWLRDKYEARARAKRKTIQPGGASVKT